MIEKIIGGKAYKILPERGVVKCMANKKTVTSELDNLPGALKGIIHYADCYAGNGCEAYWENMYTTYAKCDKRDEFDMNKGIDLAGEKMDRKNHDFLARRYRRLKNIFVKCALFCSRRASYHEEKVDTIDADIEATFFKEG